MERPLSYEPEHVQTFVSPAEAALAGLERTANHMRREIHLMLRTHGVTWTQYNVLRVLRDEAPADSPARNWAVGWRRPTPTSPACWIGWPSSGWCGGAATCATGAPS